jgi:hypothetical protein
MDELEIERSIRRAFRDIGGPLSGRVELHFEIIRRIGALAVAWRQEAAYEYPMPNFRGEGHYGYVDVVWMSDSTPTIAFEVDSCFRTKSLRKLAQLPAPHKVWVYFGMRCASEFMAQAGAGDSIRLVDLYHTSLR